MSKAITLTDEQEHAIKEFQAFLHDDDQQYMIIQGSAGTGKSTLVEFMIRAMESKFKMYALLLKKASNKSEFEVALTATTNKASAVLAELSGRDTQTIHNFLNLKVVSDFGSGATRLTTKDTYQILHNKLVILDESSMMNDELFEYINDTVHNSKIVFIGDQYQLAPVFQKKSIMESLKCRKVVMKKILRHSGPILHESAKFRETVENDEWNNIAYCNEIQNLPGPDFQKAIDKIFGDKDWDLSKSRILTWTNKRTLLYNEYVRKLRGLPSHLTPGEIVYTNKPIQAGRGFHWPTDSQVYVSDVSDLQKQKGVEGRLIELGHKVQLFLPERFADYQKLLKRLAKEAKKEKYWGEYFQVKDNWLDLRSPYASTIHKAQGATYQTVFMDLPDIGKCNISSDVARMMYVGISRAAKQVYCFGELPDKYREQ